MEYYALVVEIIFLFLGIYLYRFATGKRLSGKASHSQMEEFRKQNVGWMRILSLVLIAVMTIEIALHIYQMIN